MAGKRILVVDDEKLILELCRRILVKKGYQVKTASNGGDALKVIKQNQFNIFVTDIKMPGMDGLQLIGEVKKYRPDIIPMIITAHGTIDTAIESLKLGVMGFIIKPFTPNTLLISIENVLEKIEIMRENARLKKSLIPLFEITASKGWIDSKEE